MSDYGEVVRETAAEAHERKVEAIAAVLSDSLAHLHFKSASIRWLAERCLDAAEAGF